MTQVTVINHQAKPIGSVNLPNELFGQAPRPEILAQAHRVYTHRRRQGRGLVKTRGEVIASTRKIYRQKGTGRARHGSLSAPIFVGGGKAHGPRGVVREIKLSRQGKKKALVQALSAKVRANHLFLIADLSAINPEKTKNISAFIQKLSLGCSSKLWLVSATETSIYQGGRNLVNLDFLPATTFNSSDLLSHQQVLMTLNALNAFLSHQGFKSVSLKQPATQKSTARTGSAKPTKTPKQSQPQPKNSK